MKRRPGFTTEGMILSTAAVPDFWTYSLDVYGRPSVAEACLALQDNFSCDVNVLLLCCWAPSRGAARFDEAFLTQATETVASWQTEVIQPMRAVRRRLKQGFETVDPSLIENLRTEIGASELNAEHVEQLLLESLLDVKGMSPPPLAVQTQYAAHNINTYLDVLGITKQSKAREKAAVLVDRCCGDAEH